MSQTEALRTQLDSLRWELHELQVQNRHLKEQNPEKAASLETALQCEQYRQESELLKREYDQLLADRVEDQAQIEQLREAAKEKDHYLMELTERCGVLENRLSESDSVAELERYRCVAKEQAKWEARESRLEQQVTRLQQELDGCRSGRHLASEDQMSCTSSGTDLSEESAQDRLGLGGGSEHKVQVPVSRIVSSSAIGGVTQNSALELPKGGLVNSLAGGLPVVVNSFHTRRSLPICGVGLGSNQVSTVGVNTDLEHTVRDVKPTVSEVPLYPSGIVKDGLSDGLPLVACPVRSSNPIYARGEGDLSRDREDSALAVMSRALLAQQMPPLAKFDGASSRAEDKETVSEWLEQLELVAGVCRWDDTTKLANLVTRLKGEAYAFYKSCAQQERGSYEALVTALKRRFTPVRIQAVQSGLFHERRQKEKESVDCYAQALKGLFSRAYPSASRGSSEADTMGRFVLASQFVSGLIPQIKSRVAGMEGNLETLLTRARFEEAKLRELGENSSRPRRPPIAPSVYHPSGKADSGNSPVTQSQSKERVQCFGCGGYGHYKNKCPARNKRGPGEAPGRPPVTATLLADDGDRLQSADPKDDVDSALEKVTGTLHTLSSSRAENETRLGPVPTAQVEIEGELVEALLDTGSPVTIVSLEYLLEVLAKKRPCTQSPSEWQREVKGRLKPTSVALRNYGGGQLPVVRQIQVKLARAGKELEVVVQVQKEAPAKLLIGTDVLAGLGFVFLSKVATESEVDLLKLPQDSSMEKSDTREEQTEEDTICLLQAARIPARHCKLVRAQVSGSAGQSLSHLEPNSVDLRGKGIVMSDMVVEVDGDDCVVVVIENHSCEPVRVEAGQVLGRIGEAAECTVPGEGCVRSITSSDFLAPRLAKLQETLKIEESALLDQEVRQVQELVGEFADVFAVDSGELGSTDLETHSIDTGDTRPIKQPVRRMPFALRGKVDKMVEDMLDQGVVEPSRSPWSSPVVLVEKKDGTKRFCVDYRRLNSVTKMDVFPLPRIDDTLDLLANSQYFSSLDLASGFWQVRMDSESKEKTAFSTPSGLFEFTVMPFGLCNSPATFQRLMSNVLAGLVPKTCMVYIDDILVIGKSFEEHLSNLREVLTRLRQAGLRLKPQKCSFGCDKVVYLGYVVSREGISPDARKVEAINCFPRPRDLKSLRSFLGLASYYRRFVAGFSVVAGPLFALTKKEVEFGWSETCEEAFGKLKTALSVAPVLAYPIFDRGFILETDASGHGLGAVLLQKQSDGTIRPIAYASRTLQPHERNYGVSELEALGVVWAVKHYRHYLYGQHCEVITDHEALKSLLNTPHPSGKLARWGMALQEVDLSIGYRPGRKNAPADALSRAPLRVGDSLVPNETLVAAIPGGQVTAKSGEITSCMDDSLTKRQRADSEALEIISYLEDGILPQEDEQARKIVIYSEHFTLSERVLYFVGQDKELRVVVPASDRKQLFDEAHHSSFGGHLGAAKVHHKLSRRYWWPRMRSEVGQWCKACLVCASRNVGRPVKPSLNPIPVGKPFDMVGVDVLNLPKSAAGNQYAVVFMDYMTKWPEVFATKDQTALTIAQLLVREVVCRHGVPARLLSDRGAAFLSQLLAEICRVLGVKKVNTTAYHPQTDGLVERFNRTLTNMLSKAVERNGSDWDVRLPYVLFAYRSSMQESTRESPFFLLHGRDARLPTVLDMEEAEAVTEAEVDGYKGELVAGLIEAWQEAQRNVKKAQQAQKKYHDRHVKEPNFRPGDRVFVHMPREKSGKAYKFARPFYGPYRIKEIFENGAVVYPVSRPGDVGFRVALNRVRACPKQMTDDQTWPVSKKRAGRKLSKPSTTGDRNGQGVPTQDEDDRPRSCQDQPLLQDVAPAVESTWAGRLRSSSTN